MKKLLIGGSPCTFWSIAQSTEKRETEAEGLGWELFRNYLIAKEKFKPDFFLYENNKSAAEPIKEQIRNELGVGTDPKARFTYINSALVSAQTRNRFYVTNFGDIAQPQDRGIMLKDILEDRGITDKDKANAMTASQAKHTEMDYYEKHRETCIYEDAQPLNPLSSGKSRCLTAGYAMKGVNHIIERNSMPPPYQQWDSVAIRQRERERDLFTERVLEREIPMPNGSLPQRGDWQFHRGVNKQDTSNRSSGETGDYP